MKSETARLLRAVLRLIEDDVTAIADSVVEIDEREADHWRRIAVSSMHADEAVTDLDRRVEKLEKRIAALSVLSRDTGKRTTTLEGDLSRLAVVVTDVIERERVTP